MCTTDGGSSGGSAAGGSAAGGSAAGGSAAGGSAGCPAGSLAFLSTTTDFGSQAIGCTATAPLTVLNTCAASQTLSLNANAPFGVDAGVVTIPAGAALDLAVTFAPSTVGQQQGTATVTTSSGTLAISLRGLGATAGDVTDTFMQPSQPKSDALFVVADGSGMATAQQALQTNSRGFAQYASSTMINFQLGVLVGRSDGGGLVQGSAGAPLLLTPSTPSLDQRFGEKFALGDTGAPTVSCLQRALQHFSADAGWLRADARLGVVCTQNTYEQLPGDNSAWLALLRSATGKTKNQLTISAIANFTRACPGPEDGPLTDATLATFGARQSICTLDAGFTPDLGTSLFGYRSAFFLSRPGPADGGFDVQLDAMPVDAGVWSFDALQNALVFEPRAVPEPGRTITVRYRPVCVP